MADEVDLANELNEQWTKHRIKAIRADIAPGVPGICEYCETHSPRLINGACARCRDKYNLG